VFESVGWGEILVLVVAGLFILGPERLPSAAAWVGRTMRQVREYATGARDQLSRELGPEFEELRKPLEDLRGLRDFNPRTAVRRTLFDDGPAAGGTPPVKPNGYPLNGSSLNGAAQNGGGLNGAGLNGAVTGGLNTPPASPEPVAPAVLNPGERPPIDPDAT
jgi:sec-independent protein translocase protein TatB